MHFRGQTSPSADRSKLLRTSGSAPGCVVRTTICQSGIQTDVSASDGDLAFLESELRVTGPDQYREDGKIMFGDDTGHLLRFSTVGEGRITMGVEPGTMAGAASWKVEGGEGQFAAARGFIASTFTITKSGERSDFHCGLIFLPE